MVQPSRAPKMGDRKPLGRPVFDAIPEMSESRLQLEEELSERKETQHDGYSSDTERNCPALFIPQSKSATLTAHKRTVAAIAINPKGSRLATGGHDAEVILFIHWFNSQLILSSRLFAQVSSEQLASSMPSRLQDIGFYCRILYRFDCGTSMVWWQIWIPSDASHRVLDIV